MSGGWNTIESDAGVFTSLIESLGVKGVQFEELLTLDPSDLAALQPVHGVIFLFKYPTDRPYATPDGPLDGAFDASASERIFFAQQTIQNACATQALLSVLLNRAGDGSSNTESTSTTSGGGGGGDAAPSGSVVDIGGPLRDFRDFTMALPSDFRGEALSNSDLIREVHNSFARSSPFSDETTRDPDAATEDAFHFIAYVPVDGTLYELDGLQPHPISHGVVSSSSTTSPSPGAVDADFATRVVDVLQRRIARYDASEIRFNLLAMVGDLRDRARQTGDVELLEREERKRRDWRFENALRRHNFVGFAGQVLRGVVERKMAEGGEPAVDAWVAEGLERRKAAEAAMRSRGGGDDVDMGG